MKTERAHPTQRQVRDVLISGIIAESIAIPLLLMVILFHQHPVNWWYVAGAVACIIASVVFVALFVVVTKGRSDLSTKATAGFVIICLALTALGFIELVSGNKLDVYTPAVLVGVTLVSIIGDRPMRIGIDLFAVGLVTMTSWAAGIRGSELVTVGLVYASTIVAITWIISRAMGSKAGRINARQSIDVLHETFDDIGPGVNDSGTDIIVNMLQRGLPLVADVIPADQIAVFTRNERLSRFTSLTSWPADPAEDVSTMVELPQLDQALRSDSVVLDEGFCVIPIGYCTDGELVMVVRRSESDRRIDRRTGEAAELLAASFLRMTSRANFLSGLLTGNRTDPLTGLANRQTLYERIEIEMAHALRSETPLSVAMIDLDRFKDYNERYGHVAGDTLLRSIAALMVSNIRGQDLVARYGGEEFCLVMPETDLVGGHHLLDKLRSGGRDATSEFGVTLSAGLTSWDGFESTSSFIERADQALYRAKESGRNRVVSIQAFTEF
ncbi:MAG: GGDEF domain-containing protein [Acidimicrobiales bacterium]